ncbi:MAG: GNAT family N-acetyltransferase [Pseudomonadota bacterium]
MPEPLTIRAMTKAEVGQLVDWAAEEGWNPGLDDATLFWSADPQAFIAAELGGELIGGGAITAYGEQFGFMGFFIVKPAFRGHGFGNQLWHARRDRLRARLGAGATIGMDGVFDMQPYYAKGGFAFSHRDIRYCAVVPSGGLSTAARVPNVVSLGEVPFEQLATYDRRAFPAARDDFLRAWISQPSSVALGFRGTRGLRGYGVIRQCREGYKVGPLFADDVGVAEALLTSLSVVAAGGPMFLDTPENNPDALALARKYRMDDVFGCARMYWGPSPDIDHEKVFGVTTFELG